MAWAILIDKCGVTYLVIPTHIINGLIVFFFLSAITIL